MRHGMCSIWGVACLVMCLAGCTEHTPLAVPSEPQAGQLSGSGSGGTAGQTSAGRAGSGVSGHDAGTGPGVSGSGGVTGSEGCFVDGCSGQLCSNAASGSTCEWREEYACYRKAACERQSDGKCGWTPTQELSQCISAARGDMNLHWYSTCGDPVCRGNGISDKPDIANCTTEKMGDSCTSEGQLCDAVLSCGASLICSKSDPARGPGGCPISRARFKQEIDYLSAQELHAYHDQLMSLPLASYRYKHAPEAGPQLGFIIDDVEPSVAVSGDHVNMYGYLSMAVAAIQVQQAEIAALQRELVQLRAQLPAAATAAVCSP
jgi:hypothetical protein